MESQIERWVETLGGIDSPRLQHALSRVKSWKIRHVTDELTKPDVDSAIGAVLLVESVAALVAKGIHESKLLAKLRRDPEVWVAWAEVRAAGLLLKLVDPDGIRLEPGRDAGAQPDFAILQGNEWTHVEFKALGLSDEEFAFCQRVGLSMDALLPKVGFATYHAPLDVRPIQVDSLSQEQRNDGPAALAAENADKLPAGLSGVTIVGHGGEAHFRRRIHRRIRAEIGRQLKGPEPGWAVFYWTNGAPIHGIMAGFDWESLPQHIEGIGLLGDAVAFPYPSVQAFAYFLPRGATGEDSSVFSNRDSEFATRVWNRFEASGGVRAMLLVATSDDDTTPILRRDGERRIHPFNFLIDVDPEEVAISGRPRRERPGRSLTK